MTATLSKAFNLDWECLELPEQDALRRENIQTSLASKALERSGTAQSEQNAALLTDDNYQFCVEGDNKNGQISSALEACKQWLNTSIDVKSYVGLNGILFFQ